MSTACPLPDAHKIADLLGLLFDGLDVKPGGKFDQTPAGGSWYGIYVRDTGETAAMCGADTHLAASFGAALSMLPPAMAKEAAKSHELSAVMVENLRETMNICTRLVLDGGSPHLKLDQVYPAASLPATASALLNASQGRREFQVQLPKYGGGVMTVLSV
jgi:hypothetical protein